MAAAKLNFGAYNNLDFGAWQNGTVTPTTGKIKVYISSSWVSKTLKVYDTSSFITPTVKVYISGSWSTVQ